MVAGTGTARKLVDESDWKRHASWIADASPCAGGTEASGHPVLIPGANRLVNLDGRVPLDESNHCYKSAEEVVAAVVAAGLARVEHTLWPLASIKGDAEGAARATRRKNKDKDRNRDKSRDAARKAKGHF